MMFFDSISLTLSVIALSLTGVSAERGFEHGTRTFAVRGAAGRFGPLIRYPFRFVGKRDQDDGAGESDSTHAGGTSHSEEKRYVDDANLKLLLTILHNLRTLEMEQDQDFHHLLEKHREQLEHLYTLLPPFLNRKLLHNLLSSLMKRRFMVRARDSRKRPSFNAWGGKKKRSEHHILQPVNARSESTKRDAETVDDYTLQDDDIGQDEKRSPFNAWGGKRNDGGELEWSDIVIPTHNLDVQYPLSIDESGSTTNRQPVIEDENDFISGHIDITADQFEEQNSLDNTGTLGDKRGFNAWGGKRGYRPYGYRILGKRANFNPWGGKRSGVEIPIDTDKRAEFNAWGGKRYAAIRGLHDEERELVDDENQGTVSPSLLNIEFDTFYPRK